VNRSPSTRVLPNLVTIQQILSWTKDASGARQPVYGEPSPPIACQVQPSQATQKASLTDRHGNHREQGSLAMSVVFHGSEPDVKVRTRINWLDFNTPRILTATSPPLCGAGDLTTWTVECAYLPL
jgi:hypothetical protein